VKTCENRKKKKKTVVPQRAVKDFAPDGAGSMAPESVYKTCNSCKISHHFLRHIHWTVLCAFVSKASPHREDQMGPEKLGEKSERLGD
jgi:hypothetical protein